MYYPENEAPFFRVTVLSNYSKHNAPRDTWSLMFEVSYSKYRVIDKRTIIDDVIESARKTTLVRRTDKIVQTWMHDARYGYPTPTPTLTRDRFVNEAIRALETNDIYSRGRFGAWKYEVSNQDHTFMQGVEWVNRILLGEKKKRFKLSAKSISLRAAWILVNKTI